MNRIPLARAVAVALLAFTFSNHLALAASEKVEANHPLKADGRVQLSNVNGRIEIRAWEGEGVKLEAVKEGRTQEIVAGIKIVATSTPDLLTVKTELPRVKRGWFRGSAEEGQVSYVLWVPVGATLDKIESVNGSVVIDGVRGTVHVSTVNGSIRCHSLAGTAELETVNGSVHSMHTALKEGARLKAGSVNGAIEVQLPADLSAALEASTVNGSIRSDFEFTTSSRDSRRRVEARIREGSAHVELSTVNGSIRVRELGNEQAAAK